MNEKEKQIRDYFSNVLNKKIHSVNVKEDKIFGNVYFFNDAYVIKDYHKGNIPLLSMDRLKTVHEIINKQKISETILLIDEINKVKISKVVHGDLSFDDDVTPQRARNIAKVLKKLHKNVSEYDTPMNIVKNLYRFKEHAKEHVSKVLENRIVRELNEIKDKVPFALCHNYLTKDNLIYRYDSALLINYELANINYVYFDLASYIHENELNTESKEEFLKTYFGASYNSLKAKRVDIFINFVSLYYYYYYQALDEVTNLDFYKALAKKERTFLDTLK